MRPAHALILLTALGLAHALLFWGFTEDDAFITYRYAHHLALGLGPTFNLADRPPVEGYSNFLWLLLLAVADKAGANLPTAAALLSLGCYLLTIPLSYKLARVVGVGVGWSLLTPLGLALAAPAALWSVAGLEEPLFTLLLVAGYISLLDKEYSNLKPQTSNLEPPLWLALATLTRLDGGIFLLCGLGWVVWRQPNWGARWGRGAVWLIPALLILGGWAIWRGWYYHDLLPNPLYAKAVSGLGIVKRGLGYLGGFVLQAAWCAPLLVFVPLLRNPRANLLLVAAFLYAAAVVLAGGDWMHWYRLLVPLLPFIFVLVGALAEAAGRAASICWFVAASAALLLSMGLWLTASERSSVMSRAAQTLDTLPRIAATLRQLDQQLPAALPRTIAYNAMGIVPYYADGWTYYDPLGITDREVAHDPTTLVSWGWPGHDRYGWSLIVARRPSLIISTLGPADQSLKLADWLARLAREDSHFLDFYNHSPILQSEYTLANIQLSDGRWLQYLVRR